MRELFVLGVLVLTLMATAVQARVTITHSSTATGTLSVGDTFSVDIILGYDGTPGLMGVTSAAWDESEFMLTNMPVVDFDLIGVF